MQTVIDLPEEELTLLDKLSEARQVSRDDLVRTAVSSYLTSQQDAFKRGFGLWAGKDMEDGLEYQLRMRDEWTREE